MLTDGPKHGAPTLVFAHGSGFGADAQCMTALAAQIARHGVTVIRFDFPFMQQPRNERPPVDSDDRLKARFLEVIEEVRADGPLIVGGWSLGGRIAVQIAVESKVRRLVAVSFPFHPKRSQVADRQICALNRTGVPTLIVQGSRDSFGNQQQVKGYELKPHVEIHWFDDANHSLQPRERSGFTYESYIQKCGDRIAEFVLRP